MPSSEPVEGVAVGANLTPYAYLGQGNSEVWTVNTTTGVSSTFTYAGLSMDGSIANGQIATYGNFMYATDYDTGGNSTAPAGIVRFNLSSGDAGQRFFDPFPGEVDGQVDFDKVTVGLNGVLYGLRDQGGYQSNNLITTNPIAMGAPTVSTFPEVANALAVDASGDYFVLRDGGIDEYNSSLTLVKSLTLSGYSGILSNINLTSGGNIVADSAGGSIIVTTTQLSSYTMFSDSGLISKFDYVGQTAAVIIAAPQSIAAGVWDGGASNSWDTSSLNFTNGTAAFGNGTAVTFGDVAANGTTAAQHTNPIVITSGGVEPFSVTFTNTNLTYAFTGGAISDDGATPTTVTVNGGGTVIFSNANVYSGGTTITSGTLKADSGALLSTGTLTIGASGKLYIGDGSSSVPATLTTGAETWTGGGVFYAKVDGSGSADQLSIGAGSGALTLSGTTAFKISLQPGDSALGATPQNFEIATFGSLSGYTGSLPSTATPTVAVDSQFTLDTSALTPASRDFALDLVQLGSGADALEVVYSGTPEPTTTVLALSVLAPALLKRRVRARS